jgi:hypothetical protein
VTVPSAFFQVCCEMGAMSSMVRNREVCLCPPLVISAAHTKCCGDVRSLEEAGEGVSERGDVH